MFVILPNSFNVQFRQCQVPGRSEPFGAMLRTNPDIESRL